MYKFGFVHLKRGSLSPPGGSYVLCRTNPFSCLGLKGIDEVVEEPYSGNDFAATFY